ncbi:MAG: hypothetical protein NVS2B12_04390 [Ktedonobacteraceae bacterium]
MKMYRSSIESNPFLRVAFWGRRSELQKIYRYLQSDPPQSCALIGETYSGKTTLLRRIVDAREPFLPGELAARREFTFVYLDCISYNDAELAQRGAYSSALFWWELYSKMYANVQPGQRTKLSKPDFSVDGRYVEAAFELKFELEEIIRTHPKKVVIILDNFEGVARLPRRNSHWLRSLCQSSCTLIAASRHLLYLTYQSDALNQQDYSPLWNLFSDPIYLSLIDEDEVFAFLQKAREITKTSTSLWRPEDIDYIRKMAGRHPELLRIVCMHVFEHYAQVEQGQEPERELLEFKIGRDTRPICMQLWAGLNDDTLNSDFLLVQSHLKTEYENQRVSPYQAALLDIVYGRDVIESSALLILEQRGLIEYREGGWRVFSRIMERFIKERQKALNTASASGGSDSSVQSFLPEKPAWEYSKDEQTFAPDPLQQSERLIEQKYLPIFTYLEGKVYDYLRLHLNQVCDREEIKLAVWQTNVPSNSALQKIIERIREKMDREDVKPLHLIAVRRRGYMLRYGASESEQDRS